MLLQWQRSHLLQVDRFSILVQIIWRQVFKTCPKLKNWWMLLFYFVHIILMLNTISFFFGVPHGWFLGPLIVPAFLCLYLLSLTVSTYINAKCVCCDTLQISEWFLSDHWDSILSIWNSKLCLNYWLNIKRNEAFASKRRPLLKCQKHASFHLASKDKKTENDCLSMQKKHQCPAFKIGSYYIINNIFKFNWIALKIFILNLKIK